MELDLGYAVLLFKADKKLKKKLEDVAMFLFVNEQTAVSHLLLFTSEVEKVYVKLCLATSV
jgi:hypothetical protein